MREESDLRRIGLGGSTAGSLGVFPVVFESRSSCKKQDWVQLLIDVLIGCRVLLL